MMLKLFPVLLFLFVFSNSKGEQKRPLSLSFQITNNLAYASSDIPLALSALNDSNSVDTVKRNRLTAILLAVFTGFTGIHRVYLGTTPVVPAFYAVTLGGMGVLWITDILTIIFSKDLSPYINNKQIIMWMR